MSKEISKLKEALNSLSQLSYSTSAPKRQSQQLEVLQQQVKQLQNQLTVSVIICKPNVSPSSPKKHMKFFNLLYLEQSAVSEHMEKNFHWKCL